MGRASRLGGTSLEPQAAHPSFPHILSEITPHEALMLDRLFEMGGRTEWPAFRQRLASDFGCSEDLIRPAHWNLFRLGLWAIPMLRVPLPRY